RMTESNYDVTKASRLNSWLLVNDSRHISPTDGQQGGFSNTVAYAKLAPHDSQLFWIEVRVGADVVPGRYSGEFQLKDLSNPCVHATLPFELEVMPLVLPKVKGSHGIF